MLTKEYQVTIQVLHQQGMSTRRIARELNLARQTVRSVLAGHSLGSYRPRKSRPTKLAPYHEYLANRVQQAAPQRLASTALLRELQEQGYTGGVSQLKLYLATLQPPIVAEPVIRFETDPGQQMQIDFVVFRRGVNSLRAFTASLGYSRMSYVFFTDNERAETWVQCLEQAFVAFGGVPKSILCDNAKSVVIERHAYGTGQHRLHSLMWDVTKHYGVRVYLCQPYRAQTKGKVERFHRYLRQSFFVPVQSRLGPDPLDVATANREVHVWLEHVANTRIHATLHERPCDRFALEREALRPLPLPYQGIPVQSLVQLHETLPYRGVVPRESIQHPLHTYEQLAAEIQA